MPISAPGKSNTRGRGFTLLEILVVLFIIATVSGLLLLTVGSSPGREVQREAQRLHHLLQLAQEEAILQGEQWGWAGERGGYRFLRYDTEDQQWQLIEQRGFAPYELPPGMELTVELDVARGGNNARRQAEAAWIKRAAAEGARPAILLLSSGESTPFAIELQHAAEPAARAALLGEGIGPPYLELAP